MGDLLQGREFLKSFNSMKCLNSYFVRKTIFFSVDLKIRSPGVELKREAKDLAWLEAQMLQWLGFTPAQSAAAGPPHTASFCHVHQQQFGTVSASSSSQGLSTVPVHRQHPRQVAAFGWE